MILFCSMTIAPKIIATGPLSPRIVAPPLRTIALRLIATQTIAPKKIYLNMSFTYTGMSINLFPRKQPTFLKYVGFYV